MLRSSYAIQIAPRNSDNFIPYETHVSIVLAYWSTDSVTINPLFGQYGHNFSKIFSAYLDFLYVALSVICLSARIVRVWSGYVRREIYIFGENLPIFSREI